MARNYLSVDDLTSDELDRLLALSATAKAGPERYAGRLAGRTVALIFEKPSTRTRVSFEVAVSSMGGHAVVLRGDELQLGRGETIEDTGRVLSRYVDALVVRTFEQERLERLASAATVPVVNALSDLCHPCQALADLQTIREAKGSLRGLKLAYVGDGNNVAHSLLLGGAATGMHVWVASPQGYEPSTDVVERAGRTAVSTGASVHCVNRIEDAAVEADVLYTDVWASMGQEAEASSRAGVFEPFRLNSTLVDAAGSEVIVMHCLPAHRGEEIAADVIDGPRSVVWDQAENRLHTQKALLLWLLGLD